MAEGNNIYGRSVRERRIRAGLAVSHLAALSSVDRRTIQRIEAGRRQATHYTRRRIEDVLPG